MRKSRFTEAQIIGMLKEQEAGVPTAELCRKHGLSPATFYTLKAKYGGMDLSDTKRLKQLEDENAKLKRLVVDVILDNVVLKDLLGKPLRLRCNGGLKVPQKQAKKSRLWLNDGSCVRLRPEHPNHVWSYDFVQDRTHDGRIFRTLNIIDEFTKEALVIRVKRRLIPTAPSTDLCSRT